MHVADADFADDVITLDFPAGSSPTAGNNRQCDLIAITNDSLVEGNETFTVTGAGSGDDFDEDTITVTILDNDSEFLR